MIGIIIIRRNEEDEDWWNMMMKDMNMNMVMMTMMHMIHAITILYHMTPHTTHTILKWSQSGISKTVMQWIQSGISYHWKYYEKDDEDRWNMMMINMKMMMNKEEDGEYEESTMIDI